MGAAGHTTVGHTAVACHMVAFEEVGVPRMHHCRSESLVGEEAAHCSRCAASTDGTPAPVDGLHSRCMTAAGCTWALAAEAAAAAAGVAHGGSSMAGAEVVVVVVGAGSRRRRNAGRDGRNRQA